MRGYYSLYIGWGLKNHDIFTLFAFFLSSSLQSCLNILNFRVKVQRLDHPHYFLFRDNVEHMTHTHNPTLCIH